MSNYPAPAWLRRDIQAERREHVRELLELRLREGAVGAPEVRDAARAAQVSPKVARAVLAELEAEERTRAEHLIADRAAAQVENVRNLGKIRDVGMRLAHMRQDPRGLKVALDAELGLGKALDVAGADRVQVEHSGQVQITTDARQMALDILAAVPAALQVLGLPPVQLPRPEEVIEGADLMAPVELEVAPAEG